MQRVVLSLELSVTSSIPRWRVLYLKILLDRVDPLGEVSLVPPFAGLLVELDDHIIIVKDRLLLFSLSNSGQVAQPPVRIEPLVIGSLDRPEKPISCERVTVYVVLETISDV